MGYLIEYINLGAGSGFWDEKIKHWLFFESLYLCLDMLQGTIINLIGYHNNCNDCSPRVHI